MKGHIKELSDLLKIILKENDFLSSVNNAIGLIGNCLRGGNKVLIAGNGGSAADAQHFAAEIVGRYKLERPGYPVVALTTNTSVITAWSNDYDFSTLFSRQIEALGSSGDMFIGISTSGNSQNVIKGIEKAKSINIKTICLLGNEGGKLKGASDVSIIVPSANTPRIQEVHTLILHSITEEVERRFLQSNN